MLLKSEFSGVGWMSKTTLHITNGDGAANIIKASAVGGDVLPWRDPMHHGPMPAKLDLAALSEVRAEYLSGPGIDVAEVCREFQKRDDRLRATGNFDEVVLWFEHDLLDQLQILQILDWFSDNPHPTLSMICINAFPGVDGFRGIGQLDSMQMASLFPDRKPVTASQLRLAKDGWGAFRSSDPTTLEVFMTGDLTELSFLKAALKRYLEEFPWTSDGLTRTERQILSLVQSGISKPGRVFVDNMNFEDVLFIGDWRTFSHIANLCDADEPLLSCAPHERFKYPPTDDVTMSELREQELSLTPVGRDILAGNRDARTALQRDMWLGGVHLTSDAPMWMWDHIIERLVLEAPA